MIVEIICPYCHFSKKVSKENIPPTAKTAKCPSCRQKFALVFQEQSSEPNVAIPAKDDLMNSETEPSGAPWENRSELGLWRSISQTVKQALFSPEAFFGSQRPEDGSREPFAFGLLLGSIGTMFSFFWQFLILSEGISFFHPNAFGQFSFFLIFLAIMLIVPLFVSFGLVIYAGILHLLLVMVKGGKNRFRTTFRVVCYSQAAQLWGLIPFVGWIGGIWQWIIQIIGLKEMHETTYIRVILAFLIPFILIASMVIGTMIIMFIFLGKFF